MTQIDLTETSRFRLPLEDRPAMGAGTVVMVLALAIVVVIAPVIAVRFPPINDYPFHLARIWILNHLNDPIISEFYEAGSWLLPNIAIDVVALGLAQLVGAEIATKIFLLMCAAGLVVGPALLHRAAHGRWSVWSVLAGMLVFNGILRWGFMNYLFGVGLAFGLAAAWIMVADRRAQLAIGLVGGLVVMLCHLASFGVLAVIVSSYELSQFWHHRRTLRKASIRLIVSAIPFCICLTGFVAISPTSEGGGIDFPSIYYWKTWGGLASLSSSIIWLDALTVALMTGLVIVLMLRGQLRLSIPLVVACVMMSLVYLLSPDRVFSAQLVDTRLIVPAVMLAVIAIDFRAFGSRRLTVGVGVAVLAVLIVRGGVISSYWTHWESKIVAETTSLKAVRPGSVLLVVSAEPRTPHFVFSAEQQASWTPPLQHVASYTVLWSPAFVVMTFAHPLQQPLAVRPDYQDLKAYQSLPEK